MKPYTSPLAAFTRTLCGLLLLSLSTHPVIAQTWLTSPGTGDWNTAGNWTGGTVPNGAGDTATFGSSSITALSLSSDIQVAAVVFNAGASAFTITCPPSAGGGNLFLNLSGAGITNNSGITQNFVTLEDNSGFSGVVAFYNSATAGSQTVFTNYGGSVIGGAGGNTRFTNSSTAGSATFINHGATVSGGTTGTTSFYNTATAGTGTFTNNGGTVSGANGGSTNIFGGSAANGTFVNNSGIVSGANGGTTHFFFGATAGSGTFTNNGATVSGALGGTTQFDQNSTADSATLIANGGTGGGGGGGIIFTGTFSTGGTARVEIFGNGYLDISGHNTGVTVGSLEGSGNSFLGARFLEVGSNNLSTTFSGVIKDGGLSGGAGGSVIKTGTGTLTLSGANTYTGGTTISAGTLALGAADRLASTGPLELAGGTFATGGFNQTLGAFTLSANSAIDFGSGTSALVFANSSAISWTGTLSILNYTPSQDSLRVGTDSSGLTPAQLSQISFGGVAAQIDANGFVTAIPEPSVYAVIVGAVMLGVACWRRSRREEKRDPKVQPCA